MFTISEIKTIVEKGVYSLYLKGEPKELYEPIEYIISLGGKRIRPRLCLLTYSLFSNKIDNSIIYPSLALEIFHAFTLIHDDIMDKADKRRGQLTVHKKWNDNLAILSGDVMSILAYKYLSFASPEKLALALSLFTQTAAKVCEGQQFDMNYEKESMITQDEYIAMIGLKTAVFLACSAKMGAILSGTTEKVANALYKYGYQLGIAFQITDDYLDVYGDSKTFGKNIGGDIVNNKKSWLLVESIRLAKGKQKQSLEKIMSINADNAEEKISAMQDFYLELGVKEMAEKEIEKYYVSALDAVKDIDIDQSKLALLEEFAAMIINRKK